MIQQMIPGHDAPPALTEEPRLVAHGNSLVIKRKTSEGEQYYNAAHDRWIAATQIHAGTFHNPRASYFTSDLRAEAVLAKLTKPQP